MEHKVGEIFKCHSEWYQCVECDSCAECSLLTTECGSGTKSNLADDMFGECSKIRRSDNKRVIFKKLENVGEPYNIGTHTFQRYKVFMKPYIFNDSFFTVNTTIDDEFISIEVKQNQENMEEYKMHDVREDIPEFDKIVNECLFGKEKPNLKPFDLEQAKAGKLVCTRDGRKARIICFDKAGVYPIIALVQKEKSETCHFYSQDGKCTGYGNEYDLMMLSDKKEGWINIYSNRECYYGATIYATKEEASDNALSDCISTVKIQWN